MKRQIKAYILLLKPFKGTSPREAFNSWEKAYKEGKPWAQNVLANVVEIRGAVRGLVVS
jgi:hypothetical protein